MPLLDPQIIGEILYLSGFQGVFGRFSQKKVRVRSIQEPRSLVFKTQKAASGGSVPVLCSIAGVCCLIVQRFHTL